MHGSGEPRPIEATRREVLVPDLLTVVRDERYGPSRLARDAAAGLTVAIVALPLSMAIAIASGLPPERGLYTAIVGGFLISLLGGSRHQIGGPAGAFIVVVAAVLERHGYDGLVLATMIAGLMMMAAGLLRLGTLVHRVPTAVAVGFTAGIGVVIFASQLRELLGLTLAREPSAFLPKIGALWIALSTINAAAIALSLGSIALILGLRRWRPTWPGLLITVVMASLVVWLAALDVATIGSRFGGVPSGLPTPVLPDVSWARVIAVLPDAVTIALLGGIESLLSAVVADKMSGRTHRSNIELVAQGVANIGSVSFGGMPATGTIARTATNVRAGATSPVSGMLHAVYLLAFMVAAAGLAAYVPLAALAGILAVTSWNMVERDEIAHMLRADRPAAAVMATTALVTIFLDLLSGIGCGIALAVVLGAIKAKAAAKTHRRGT